MKFIFAGLYYHNFQCTKYFTHIKQCKRIKNFDDVHPQIMELYQGDLKGFCKGFL